MSLPGEPNPAKLIMGFLYRDRSVLVHSVEALTRRFGLLDFATAPSPFNYTDYYNAEMGGGLLRRTVSFLDLVPQETLPEIKLFTNALEKETTTSSGRAINIDPGLLTLERLVLATGKNFTHRIYLRRGIYADLTLLYQGGAFRTFDWTYPDYREPALHQFLKVVRQKLVFQETGRPPRKAL